MSAGDQLTTDYQFQLHTTLYGRGTNGVWIEMGKSVEGLGVPDVKTQDVEYARQDGSYANPDYLQVRQITIPCVMRITSTVAAVMTNLKALTLAWVPVAADTDLAFQLPGWNKFYVNGRPRGAKVDLTDVQFGAVRVLLRFDCPDPTINYL
jgi:hypothetical protein